MKNKRSLILLGLLLVLGGFTVYSLMQNTDRGSTLSLEERNFAVEDTAAIHKIFMADRFNHQTTLERKGKGWLHNGQHPVNLNAMDNLMDAIKRVKIQFKPPNASIKNLIKSLATEGIKVEIYDRQDQLLKAYYVGGSTPDERGTYMMIEGAEQPYVASIPGFTGNIRFRYNLLGDDWRDKAVFNVPVDQIQSVSINYPLQRSESFTVSKAGQGYEVKPYYALTKPTSALPNQSRVETFLYHFERILAESFINEHPKKDSILQQVPFCEIQLATTTGDSIAVALHPRYFMTAPSGPEASQRIVERYYANVNQEDFMLVQNEVFKKVFWGYAFFFE
ncbi:MAG: DUF4340 domain-containing protein [Saprospiraceae bacterium]|nr:DUF4340 domain-containing protein [Saprospiraceae bacterium]